MITSAFLYNISIIGYVISLFIYSYNLIFNKKYIRKIATILVSVSFICQTIGMSFRWLEAGFIEVLAYEKSLDIILKGISWFVIFMQHPPWTNLYEIMVYMSWGLIVIFLISEIKWRIKFLEIVVLILALTAIGLASLSEGTINPLVPALKSWWLMLHVISASIAYSAGTIGAFLSLMYLIKSKENITISSIASGMMMLSALIGLLLGRGFSLLTTASYSVKLLSKNNNMNVVYEMNNYGLSPVFISSSYIGIALLLAIISSIFSSILLFKVRKINDVPSGLAKNFYFIASGFMLSTVLLIIYNNISNNNIMFSYEIMSKFNYDGPYCLGFKSNPWDLALFIIMIFCQFLIGFTILFPNIIRNLLPNKYKIDSCAYANIIIAFILVGLVLITGALWANYAWGRYWGWDPKETGALVIWIVYALYLHTRVIRHWSNISSAIIAIFAFFAILAGFLGVNLGFFSDGLHSYGNG